MNILEKIVADKKIEIERRQSEFPLAEFKDGLSESDRDFKQALIDDKAHRGAAYILECKKASPSKGLIREQFDLDEICEAYGKYASCVSVLTDQKYFQGEFERLPKVRNRLSQPVLCKDFFVSSYQVYLARHFGANAILLMLSVLNDEEYQELNEIAHQLGMHVLTEVSNVEEMRRAVELQADILGINNRNLRDLSTDLNQTPELIALFKQLTSEEQQNNTVLISESGIYHHDQVQKLNDFVDGYLVGSSLMAEKNLIKACSNLIQGKHKVCGLTRSEDAISAAKQGASYGGLIFVEKSPRFVSVEQAKDIIDSTRTETNLAFVAVVQNHSVESVLELTTHLDIRAIQLHGEEDQTYIDLLSDKLKEQNSSIEIWKVIGVPETGVLPETWPTNVNRIVLDTKLADGQNGGTGKTFDWSNLKALPLDLPPVTLAGGLNAENLERVRKLPIDGVDLNSGVESAPGIKDKNLVTKAFKVLLDQTN